MAIRATMTNARPRLRLPQALLASCLAAMLCLSMLPIAAFAEEEAPAEYLSEENAAEEYSQEEAVPSESLLPENSATLPLESLPDNPLAEALLPGQQLTSEQPPAGQLETQATLAVSAGWIKNYGGSQSDTFSSVTATIDGGYVSVGYSISSNGDLPGNKGNNDFIIAKFDANGNKAWLKNYGGSGNDVFYSVVAASDGGYVAVGDSDSSNGDLSGNRGSNDFVVAKFDANGNKLWIENYGGSSSDLFRSVVATTDGGYVAVGDSTSSNGDLNLSGNKGSFGDFIIAKFDASGNKLWIRNYGGSYIDSLQSLVATPDGGFVAVGGSYSSNGDLSNSNGDYHFVMTKFNASGNKIWIRSYGDSKGSNRGDSFSSVTTIPDGGYIAVGLLTSTLGDFRGNKGFVDFVIAKFDASGNKIWMKNYGGGSADSFSL